MTVPLPHRKTLSKAALAVLAGLFAAGAVAAPASAAPSPFSVEDVGEDLCTVFQTAGSAEWELTSIPEAHPVLVTGRNVTWVRDGNCLAVVPLDRSITVTAYGDGGRTAVDQERIPMAIKPSETSYEFVLSAPDWSEIDFLTVAICIDEPTTGSAEQDCTDPVFVFPA